jgi:hypothetical protein
VTDLSPDQAEELTRVVADLVAAGLDRDVDRLATLVCDVGERFGDRGIYSICCGLANVAEQIAFPPLRGFAQLDMVDGRPPEEQDDQASLWAARFVTASLNADSDTRMALFLALTDENAGDSLAALITMTTDLVRASRGG